MTLPAQHCPAVSPALRFPLLPLEHQVLPTDPRRPGGRVLGAREPQGLAARTHQDESRVSSTATTAAGPPRACGVPP